MADIVDVKTRSKMMAGIRGRDTRPELIVRKYLFRKGFRYRLHNKHLTGKPDLALSKYRSVVFVHGCFWHRHSGCKYAYTPKSNRVFWKKKLGSNVLRDIKVRRQLKKEGWHVHVIWECQLRERDLKKLADKIRITKRRRGWN